MFQGSERNSLVFILTIQPLSRNATQQNKTSNQSGQKQLSQAISSLNSLLKKFRWDFPVLEVSLKLRGNWLNVFGDEPWPTVIGETAANMADTSSTKPWGKRRTLKLLKATVFSPAWAVSECCLVLGLLFYEKQLPAWSLNSQKTEREPNQ